MLKSTATTALQAVTYQLYSSNFFYSEDGSIILYRNAAPIYKIKQCHNTEITS
jgi:hypothetical protein